MRLLTRLLFIPLAASLVGTGTCGDSPDWWITLETGSPVTTTHRIRIHSTGSFEILRRKNSRKPFQSVAEGEVEPAEVQRIVEAARKEIEAFEFPTGKEEERFDGANITLTLSSNYSDASIGYRSVSPEGPWPIETARIIFDTINPLVPEELRVW